jgi:ribosome-binding protein aMBF1 (putative translation factor)
MAAKMAKAETYHKFDKKLVKRVGDKIRNLRKEAGLTIEELSDRAEINPKYLQRCETGKVNPTISVIYSLAKTLKISLKDFFQDM